MAIPMDLTATSRYLPAPPLRGLPRPRVENWVNSPGHLRTILDSRADGLGVGVERHEGVTYCYLFVGMSSTINPYA